MKSLVKQLLKWRGYDIVPHLNFPFDLTKEEKEIYKAVAPFTMTSVERIVAVIHATKYVVENDIKGDVVECGVWRGGSMMAVAHTLKRLGDTTRNLYLYDTFTGMTAPTAKDKQYDGVRAHEFLKVEGASCVADKYDVMTNLRSTGYPEDKLLVVEGKVEETIPQTMPASICLLRLDTDWYESTKHELTHLYPKLVSYGVLIIDDYGYWQGAKEAVDEYFNELSAKPFLHRIDNTGRLTIKI